MNTDRLRTARPLASLRQGRNDWYTIKNQAEPGTAAEVWIYDEIGWFGVTAQDFVKDLRGVDADAIDLHLNTPGGDVFDGLAILEALRSHKARVTVYVDSLAASIGSVIAMAGDRVVMARNATMMIHDGHGLAIGNAADMREMADLLDKCSDNIASVYAERAGGTVDEWRAAMRATTWYSADEAVTAGLADEVKAGGKAGPDNTWDLSIFDRVIRVDPENPGDAGYRRREPAAEGVHDHGHPAPELRNTAVGPHSTAVREGTWDKAAQEKHLPSPMPVSTARRFYAAYDADAVADGKLPKSAGHLPHHEVSADGTPGAAILAGVRNALSQLPKTHGLTEAERDTAERHLQAHLSAAEDGADDRVQPPAFVFDPDMFRIAVKEAAK